MSYALETNTLEIPTEILSVFSKRIADMSNAPAVQKVMLKMADSYSHDQVREWLQWQALCSLMLTQEQIKAAIENKQTKTTT